MSLRPIVLAALLVSLVACGGEDKGTSKKSGEKAPAANSGGGGGGGGAPYEAAKGTAVLKGVVKYKGARPAPAFQNTSSEPRCEAHGQVMKEAKEVNEDLTLPHAFVYVSKGPSLGLTGYADPKVEVDQVGCAYTPHTVGAMVKNAITFKNTDQFNHNVKVQGPGLTWNKTQSGGATDEWTPGSKAMGARITCDVHTWMAAYLHVLDHPFFATSARGTGSFEIKGLYPGKYTVKVWHETWAKDKGGKEFEVELKDGDNAVEWEIEGDQ